MKAHGAPGDPRGGYPDSRGPPLQSGATGMFIQILNPHDHDPNFDPLCDLESYDSRFTIHDPSSDLAWAFVSCVCTKQYPRFSSTIQRKFTILIPIHDHDPIWATIHGSRFTITIQGHTIHDPDRSKTLINIPAPGLWLRVG